MADNQLTKPVIVVCTLFDITHTGVTKSTNGNAKLRNQQRNWETLQQVLGLRTQPLELESPKVNVEDLSCHQFNSKYSGTAQVWQTEFTVDQHETLAQNNNPVALLEQDANLIPMITGLNESVSLNPACLHVNDNIYFKLIFRPIVTD